MNFVIAPLLLNDNCPDLSLPNRGNLWIECCLSSIIHSICFRNIIIIYLAFFFNSMTKLNETGKTGVKQQ